MTSAPSAISTKSPTIRRILREAAEISNSPSPDYTAEPLESDLFEWHFTLRGPPNSVYSEGVYHGKIVLPPAYPLRPPSFRFSTPSGRFEANREICLSISGHHEETWQPAWGIRTAIVALRSFMETDARGQLGGLETSASARRTFAKESGAWTCPTCTKSNADIIKECEERYEADEHKNAAEVAVPEELKMAFKDELSGSKEKPTPTTSGSANDDSELAEGFVQTAPVAPAPASIPITRTNGLRNRTIPAPVHDAPLHAQAQLPPQGQLQQQQRRAQPEDPPLWLDRAIVILAIVLVGLLVKVLFDF